MRQFGNAYQRLCEVHQSDFALWVCNFSLAACGVLLYPATIALAHLIFATIPIVVSTLHQTDGESTWTIF